MSLGNRRRPVKILGLRKLSWVLLVLRAHGLVDRVRDRVEVLVGLLAGDKVVEPQVQLLDRRAVDARHPDRLLDHPVLDVGLHSRGDVVFLVGAVDGFREG